MFFSNKSQRNERIWKYHIYYSIKGIYLCSKNSLYIEELKEDEDYFKKLSLVIFGDAEKEYIESNKLIEDYANETNIGYFHVNTKTGDNLKEGLYHIAKLANEKRKEKKKINNENQQKIIKKNNCCGCC